MAPDAGEWTAFEKYGDADAGTVVDGVAFDVEDQGLLHSGVPLFLSQVEKFKVNTGGVRPASRVHFLCVDKENGTKRKRPQCSRLPAAGFFRSENI